MANEDSVQLDPMSVATVAASHMFEAGADVARLVCGNCGTSAMFAQFCGMLIPIVATLGLNVRMLSAQIPYCSNCTKQES